MDLNKAMIIGRLTRDPETRTTPQGANVCSFSIATNFSYVSKDGSKQDQVEYHNVVAWRKLGEIAQSYLKKGSQVYIEGRIQTRNWDDKEGQKKNRTEIIADQMIMLGSPRGGSGSGQDFGGSNSGPQQNGGQDSFTNSLEQIPTINQDSSGEEISVEDIPF